MSASDSVVVGEGGGVVVDGFGKSTRIKPKHAPRLHAFAHVTYLHHGLDHR